MRISDWSSDVCSSDLVILAALVLNRDLLRDDAGAGQRKAGKTGGPAPLPLAAILTLPVVMCFAYFMFTSIVALGLQHLLPATLTSEERRGGKVCGSTCRSLWSPCL